MSDDDCDFTTVINDTVYRSECDYEPTGSLVYEFSLNIYWKTYEIEEDYTLTYPVNIIDRDSISSYWEAIIAVFVIVIVLCYGIAILFYLRNQNLIKWKIFENKKYYAINNDDD